MKYVSKVKASTALELLNNMGIQDLQGEIDDIETRRA